MLLLQSVMVCGVEMGQLSGYPWERLTILSPAEGCVQQPVEENWAEHQRFCNTAFCHHRCPWGMRGAQLCLYYIETPFELHFNVAVTWGVSLIMDSFLEDSFCICATTFFVPLPVRWTRPFLINYHFRIDFNVCPVGDP